MANSSLCNPVFVTDDALLETPQRISFDGKAIDERWIQDIIQKQPNILPASYFDVRYKELLSVGCEVELGDGFIDNLLVTPNGDLVVVETKLWRNPEARRRVVAQITDYAKSLMNWSFDKFDFAAKEYSKEFVQKEIGIVDLVKQSFPAVDEKEFHDNLERNLLQGKILLLIVGDGIRENAEDLVEFFQRFTNIQFTLGLIELKIYQASKTQRLVIPDILFKTKEIQRAVISFEGMDPKKINVKVDNSLEIESQTKKKNKTLTPEEYFCRLKENAGNDAVVFAQKVLTDFSAKGYAMCWNTESFSIRAFDSETKMKQSIFAFTGDGQLWFWNNKYVTEDQNSELSNSIHAFYPELTFDDVWSFLRLANENNYNNFIGIIDKFARLTIEGMRNKK